jgi:hypothetical protein
MIDADSVEPVRVDGAELLDDVHATLTRYVVFADDHQPVAVTLWVAATHGLPAWQHATRLIITSPQKRCGKSRLMDIVAGLSFSPLLCVDTTTAAVYRSIGDDDAKTPTLLIDEADALFGTKRSAEQNEDLRALLNAGWQRDRPARRCVGPLQVPTDFATFSMAALAAIGRLPDTVSDRGASIDLKRRGPGERISRFRIRRDRSRLTDLRGRLTYWVRDRIDDLAVFELELAGVEDRAADAWEPLIAVADAAGGDWPGKARAACRALTATATDADDELGALLLADIRQIFADTCESFIASNMLVRELRAIEESPWGDDSGDYSALTTSKLAKLLRPYGVRPGHNPAKTIRGYDIGTFGDAFRRYLRPEPSSRPKTGSDQDEPENSQTVPHPSEPVQPDGSGHLTDTSSFSGETPEHAGQSDMSDDWTASDGTPERNGIPVDGCQCGRPAPVNPETGLCHWCETTVSKQRDNERR